MKQPQHRAAKPFTFEFEPALQLIGGDIVYIDRLFYPGICIGSLGTDGADQLVVFIGSGESRGFETQSVNFCIQLLFSGRILFISMILEFFARSDRAVPFPAVQLSVPILSVPLNIMCSK
jgi:hypothetical protein